MSLVSFMSEPMSADMAQPMSAEKSSLMFNPLSNIVQSIIADANGAMLDPSDMTTMFQDAAGTIPVTAVEQPVGKIIDKSGRGNHATQSVTASRPKLSARKNLLLATETLATQSVASIAASYVLSFYGTGSVTLSGTATGTLTGTSVNDRVSLTVTPTAGTLTLTVSGSVTKAQLELGASAGPYQRINTATDYDTDPLYFPKYLRFDGIDDYLNLPYMGLYAGGSASMVVAFYADKLSTTQSLLEERYTGNVTPVYVPARFFANSGGTDFFARNDANAIIVAGIASSASITDSNARILSIVDGGVYARRYTNSQLSASGNYIRTGVLSTNTTVIGAGIYGDGKTIVDRLRGAIYSLIITKSAMSDAQRIQCERYAASKAGVIL